MLIAARESFAAAARKRLPYDAEVAYLQSSGTQYIDTGILADSSTDISLHFAVTSRAVTQGVFGRRIGALNNSMLLLQYKRIGSEWWLRWDRGTGSINVLSVVANHVYSAASSGMAMTIDSTTASTTSTNSSGISLYLFAVNQGGSPILLSPSLRIYDCAITSGGTTLRDYIPVRVGSGSSAVGYMYDKVSGTLFGNAGTGSFTIGPDKTA